MTRKMSGDEWRAFVSEGTRTAVLATGEDTLKGRALRRDPRVSLCIDDATPPFSFVHIERVVALADISD